MSLQDSRVLPMKSEKAFLSGKNIKKDLQKILEATLSLPPSERASLALGRASSFPANSFPLRQKTEVA